MYIVRCTMFIHIFTYFLLAREEAGEQEDWKWRDKEEIERRAKKKKEEKKSRGKNGGDSAFSEKDRSGKEGEDLLKPPYNSDFDLGGKVDFLTKSISSTLHFPSRFDCWTE